MLSEMPGKAKAYKEGLMWDAPQSLYIDLCTFLEPNNMDAFKDSLKTLCETIQEKDNVINTRTFDVQFLFFKRKTAGADAALAVFFMLQFITGIIGVSMADFWQG